MARMSDSSSAQSPFAPLATWTFWRNQAVYFCAFSLVGHWLEILYCLFMDANFGIVDPESLVWEDAFYPFPVYGFGVLVCAVVMVPLKQWLLLRCKGKGAAAGAFFIIGVVAAMAMELAQGFLQNQPDENGVYPLWDNSHLPLNILGQAWLVNDVMISLVMLAYVWLLYPVMERGIAKLPQRAANVGAVLIVVGFIVLCAVKFA